MRPVPWSDTGPELAFRSCLHPHWTDWDWTIGWSLSKEGKRFCLAKEQSHFLVEQWDVETSHQSYFPIVSAQRQARVYQKSLMTLCRCLQTRQEWLFRQTFRWSDKKEDASNLGCAAGNAQFCSFEWVYHPFVHKVHKEGKSVLRKNPGTIRSLPTNDSRGWPGTEQTALGVPGWRARLLLVPVAAGHQGVSGLAQQTHGLLQDSEKEERPASWIALRLHLKYRPSSQYYWVLMLGGTSKGYLLKGYHFFRGSRVCSRPELLHWLCNWSLVGQGSRRLL